MFRIFERFRPASGLLVALAATPLVVTCFPIPPCNAAQSADLEIDVDVLKGEEHVAWINQIDLPANSEIKDWLQIGNECYFADSNGLITKIDSEGNKSWAVDPTRGRRATFDFLVPGLSADGKAIGVDAFFHFKVPSQTRTWSIDANGESSEHVAFDIENEPSGAVRLSNGDLLFFGFPPHGSDPKGWVARTDSKFKRLWSKTFSPEIELPDKRPKMIVHSSFQHAIVFPDESIALIGQTGIYGKFGVGDSKLWVLKIDQKGNKLAEAFVDDSYFNAHSNLPVRTSSTELFIRHWKYTPNPVDLGDRPQNGQLWPWFSRFDFDLNLVSQQDLSNEMPPNTATVGGFTPNMFPMLQTNFGAPMILRQANEMGTEDSRVELDQEHGFMKHLTTIEFPKGTLWAIQVDHPKSKPGTSRRQLLLLMIRQ